MKKPTLVQRLAIVAYLMSHSEKAPGKDGFLLLSEDNARRVESVACDALTRILELEEKLKEAQNEE
jgi:hypothetical protein